MKSHALAPRKPLGQNFLVAPHTRERIVTACELRPDEEIIEIGPGLGHLTEDLLARVKKIYAVEKDRRFCEELRKKFAGDKLEVIEADILRFDLTTLPKGLKVIGNLPYYISTPIIEKFIEKKGRFPECFFTVQKEFAERLCAKPGGKDYGSLTCFVQYYADVKILFKIPPGAFKPAPKVDSAFMKINFREPAFKDVDEKRLFQLIRTAFGQRRKKISNSLKTVLGPPETFKKCGLTGEERAENLSLKNYIDLTKG